MERRADRNARRWWRLAVVPVVAAVALVGCGKDDDQNSSDAEEVVESAGARALAEAIRVTLVTDGNHDDRRTVEALEEAVSDIPGSPEITGIEDDDGDGRDDDGNVVIHVDDEVACLSVDDDGQDVDVTGGEC
jgi:hypothetical protein